MMYGFYVDKDGIYHLVGSEGHTVFFTLPQDVYDVVCAYRGRTLSEKLINFVLDHAMEIDRT